MKDKNSLIKGSRLLLSLFIIYEIYIQEAFGSYPIILYGTVICATIFVAVDIISNNGKLPALGFPFVLIIYGVYSFVAGLVVSRDISWFYSTMLTYFAFSIVCFDCCYVIKKNGSSKWLFNTFFIVAIACSIHTIFFGADFQTEVIVRTMSVDNNPNNLGFAMVVGIFSLISRKKYVFKRFWSSMAIVLAFLYVILLTASRKCLFAALAMVFIWIITVLRTEKLNLKKISIIVCIAIAIGFGVYYFITSYSTTSSYERMLLLNEGASTRTEMYQDAIKYWRTSPIIGIGFCQYQIWSPFEAYSHSSYAEILCCTGVIGALMFFTPLIYYFTKIAKVTFVKDCNKYDYLMCLAFAAIELFLGAGQIYLYNVSHLLVLSYLTIAVDCITIEADRDESAENRAADSLSSASFQYIGAPSSTDR